MTTLLFCALLGGVGGPDKAAKFDFRLRPTPGLTANYLITTEMTPVGASGEASFTAEIKTKFTGGGGKEIKWHNTTAIKSASGTGVFKGFGEQIKAVDGFSFVAVTNDLGHILRYEKNEALAARSETPNLVFPGKPVGVGDSWSHKVDVRGEKVGIKYTFRGFEALRGRELGKVIGVYDDSSVVKALSPTTIYFDPKTGVTDSANGHIAYKMGDKTLRLKFKVSRR